MANTFIGGIKLPKMNLGYEIPTEKFKPSLIQIKLKNGYCALVSEGEEVKIGTPLAACEGKEDLVSGISGRAFLSRKDGYITIENDYLDTLSENSRPIEKSINEISEEEIKNSLKKMGISLPIIKSKRPNHLIVSACEAGPHTYSETRILFENSEEVVYGAKIIMKLLGAAEVVFAVPKSMYKAANALVPYLGSRKMMRTKLVSDKYPQFMPHLLVSSLFNLEINSLKSTEEVGYPTVKASLCSAVYNALAKGKPYTEGIITVSNSETSANFVVPFGTELKELAAAFENGDSPCCMFVGDGLDRIRIDGDCFTDKNTYSLIINQEKAMAKPHTCIGCGRCHDVCPMKLVPSLIYEALEKENHKSSKLLGAEYCIECGCCNEICPSGLDLRGKISSEKNFLKSKETAHE